MKDAFEGMDGTAQYQERAKRALLSQEAQHERLAGRIARFNQVMRDGGIPGLQIKDMRLKVTDGESDPFVAVARVCDEGEHKVAFYNSESAAGALLGLLEGLANGTLRLHPDKYALKDTAAPPEGSQGAQKG